MRVGAFLLAVTLSLSAFCPMTLDLGMDGMSHGEMEAEAQTDCLTGQCFVSVNEEGPVLALSAYTVIPDLPAREFESTVPESVGNSISSTVPRFSISPPTKTIVLRL